MKQRGTQKMITGQKKTEFGNFLLFMIMVEVFTGGGGDFYAIHIFGVRLTVRIILFVILIISYLISSRGHFVIDDAVVPYVYILVSYNTISCLIGCIINDTIASITSFFSTLYLIAYSPMMKLSKNRNASYSNVYKIMIFCATIIASITLLVYVLVNLSIVNVYDARNFFDSIQGDWWMRNTGSIVYPSQLFILIAFLWIFCKMIFYKVKLWERFLLPF